MTWHNYTPPTNVPTKYPHLTSPVSEIQPRQTLYHHPPAHPDAIGENNTWTYLKGYRVEMAKILLSNRYINIQSEKGYNTIFSVIFIYISLYIIKWVYGPLGYVFLSFGFFKILIKRIQTFLWGPLSGWHFFWTWVVTLTRILPCSNCTFRMFL